MQIVEKMQTASRGMGYSTNAYLAIKWLLGQAGSHLLTASKRQSVDRIVVVSDMNCYNDNGYGGESLVGLLAQYRAEVNRDVFYYSVNLMGGAQAQMDPQNAKTLLLSGFSEKVFSLFQQFESGEQKTEVSLPTIAELRRRYQLVKSS
jgi:hypothetical protein